MKKSVNGGCGLYRTLFLIKCVGEGSHSESNEVDGAVGDDEGGGHQTIASLLRETLLQDRLALLSEKNLVEAVDEFVGKNEKEAISE